MGEWGFDGVVISDWFATHTTDATLLAGTHLEMPGPARHLGPAAADAVREGRVPADVVDDAARRVLRLADRVGASTEPSGPERGEDDPGRWDLAVEASAASMVLLRNRSIGSGPQARAVLPLDPGIRRLAVIGPNAEVAVAQGGGSARVLPHRTVAPLAGLRARFPETDVVFAPGAPTSSANALLDGRFAHSSSGPGLHIDYRAERDGPVVASATLAEANPIWSGRFAAGIDPLQFHATATTTLTARRTGPHELELASVGECTLSIDGEVVLRTDPSQSSDALLRLRHEAGSDDGRSRRRRAAPSRGGLRPPARTAGRRLPHPHRRAHGRRPDRRRCCTGRECRRGGGGGRHGLGHRVRGLRSQLVRPHRRAGRARPPRGGGQPAHGRRGERRRRGRPPVARRRGSGAAHVVPRHGGRRGARRCARR